MTQKEFEDRTGLKPTNGEFGYIVVPYKAHFCEILFKYSISHIF